MILTDKFVQCVCRDLNCEQGKQTLQPEMILSRLSRSLRCHGDEWVLIDGPLAERNTSIA